MGVILRHVHQFGEFLPTLTIVQLLTDRNSNSVDPVARVRFDSAENRIRLKVRTMPSDGFERIRHATGVAP